MTGRATFGDFAAAASRHLARALSLSDPATTSRSPQARTMHASEIRRAMSRIVGVLSQYVADITAPSVHVLPSQLDVLTPWMRAAMDARRALLHANALLAPDGEAAFESSLGRSASPIGRELGAAITAMTVGRDLLHTHVSLRADGSRSHRSEWALVVVSVPVSGALMHEVGRWAQMTAVCAEQVPPPKVLRARNAGDREVLAAQGRLLAACQSLHKVHAAAESAQDRQPVSAADMRLLHAIPANMLPIRRQPGSRDSAADLSQGTSDCAERTRYAARAVAPLASWSPQLTSDSLRQTAASATAVSHHCSIVLHTLSAQAFRHGLSSTGARLFESAADAERARDAWLATARVWELVTTETRGITSPVAIETADLALWTGRLAFADPTWSLAQGPVQPWRSPESLVPTSRHLPAVVAAAHQACDALVQLAAADHQQICQAARAGRLHSPTRTLPDTSDIPHPFGRTPRDRVRLLLASYQKACETSAQATEAVAGVAQAVRAPSTVLAAARAAARMTNAGLLIDGLVIDNERVMDARIWSELPEPPGHFERILSELGETDPVMLKRAAAVDLAGEQLMIESARVAEVTYGTTVPRLGAEHNHAHAVMSVYEPSREPVAEI